MIGALVGTKRSVRAGAACFETCSQCFKTVTRMTRRLLRPLPFVLLVAFVLDATLSSIAAPPSGGNGESRPCCVMEVKLRREATNLDVGDGASALVSQTAGRPGCVYGDGQRQANGARRFECCAIALRRAPWVRSTDIWYVFCVMKEPPSTWVSIWLRSTFRDVKPSVACNRAVLFRQPSFLHCVYAQAYNNVRRCVRTCVCTFF